MLAHILDSQVSDLPSGLKPLSSLPRTLSPVLPLAVVGRLCSHLSCPSSLPNDASLCSDLSRPSPLLLQVVDASYDIHHPGDYSWLLTSLTLWEVVAVDREGRANSHDDHHSYRRRRMISGSELDRDIDPGLSRTQRAEGLDCRWRA